MDADYLMLRMNQELARAQSAECARARIAHEQLADCFRAEIARVAAAKADPRIVLRPALATDIYARPQQAPRREIGPTSQVRPARERHRLGH